MTSIFNGATILVTGGTGSFGREFVRMTLEKYNPKKIVIFSRDEMKQWSMAEEYAHETRLRFFIGDVRDKERLSRACNGVDIIIHAAAMKIITTAEYNPFECIRTNVMGAMNVIDCAIDSGVKRVVALSTDKACSPSNLYGATKLCSDKLFIAGNSYVGSGVTRFSVVRYGNVMGSRGSVIPLFLHQMKSGEITITHEHMTRFMIRLDQAIEMVWHAAQDSEGGEIYVRKIPSMRVVDIAKTLAPDAKIRCIGIRPGEKMHEQMISAEESRSTWEYDFYYKIKPQIRMNRNIVKIVEEQTTKHRDGIKVPDNFVYSSESNSDWMLPEELQEWACKSPGESFHTSLTAPTITTSPSRPS
jgi:UDP-N-acetylglucosamine 4,6-dehydratase (inverting)